MSKHCCKHEECCTMPMGGYGYGYGMQGYGGGGGCGSGGGWGIRWIYALLVLIVIVLQFGRKDRPFVAATTGCGCEDGAVAAKGFFDGDQIDRSVLFIIIVFLLILCGGCWAGGQSNYGAQGSQGFGY